MDVNVPNFSCFSLNSGSLTIKHLILQVSKLQVRAIRFLEQLNEKDEAIANNLYDPRSNWFAFFKYSFHIFFYDIDIDIDSQLKINRICFATCQTQRVTFLRGLPKLLQDLIDHLPSKAFWSGKNKTVLQPNSKSPLLLQDTKSPLCSQRVMRERVRGQALQFGTISVYINGWVFAQHNFHLFALWKNRDLGITSALWTDTKIYQESGPL